MLHKRGFLGTYLLITFTLSYQHDQSVGVCSSTQQKRNRHTLWQRGSWEWIRTKMGGVYHGTCTCTGDIYQCSPKGLRMWGPPGEVKLIV